MTGKLTSATANSVTTDSATVNSATVNSATVNRVTVKTAAATAAGLALASALLAGCSTSQEVPADGEYQGVSGESTSTPSSSGTSSGAATDDAKDSGTYKDGVYEVAGQKGPSGDDTIDVKVGVAGGDVTSVDVVGHASTELSKQHQDAFIHAVPGAVVGKPLKGLSVHKVAGASWTSEAFNTALKTVREQASTSNR